MRPAGDPPEDAFDHWLRRELGRLYDATLSEPVPDSLRDLLDQTAPAAPAGETKKG